MLKVCNIHDESLFLFRYSINENRFSKTLFGNLDYFLYFAVKINKPLKRYEYEKNITF